MKVLLATHWSPYGTADSVKFALESCGHSVAVYDYKMNPLVGRMRKIRVVGRDSVSATLVRILGLRDAGFRRLMDQWKPDLLLVLKGETIHRDDIGWARRRGIITVNWFPDDPQLFRTVSRHFATSYDFFRTNSVQVVDRYRALGCRNISWIGCGCEPRYQKRLPPQEIDGRFRCDVCFIGTCLPERVELISALADTSEISIKVWGRGWHRYKLRNGRGKLHVGSYLSWHDEMVRAFNGASIVINTTNKSQRGWDLNSKVYEATACRSFVLTNRVQSLARTFSEGTEVATYGNAGEFLDAVEYYIPREREREDIAKAGQTRAYQDHTMLHRVQEILISAVGEPQSVSPHDVYGLSRT